MPAYCLYFIYTAIMAVVLFALVPRMRLKGFCLCGNFWRSCRRFSDFYQTDNQSRGIYKLRAFRTVFLFPAHCLDDLVFNVFYFLPDDLIWMVIYVLTAAAASVMFSNVLANLNIFTWHYSKIFIPFLIYLSWFAASTWAFKRLNKQHP